MGAGMEAPLDALLAASSGFVHLGFLVSNRFGGDHTLPPLTPSHTPPPSALNYLNTNWPGSVVYFMFLNDHKKVLTPDVTQGYLET